MPTSTLRRIAELAAFLVLATVAAWVYYFLSLKMGMEETEAISRAMGRLNRSRGKRGA